MDGMDIQTRFVKHISSPNSINDAYRRFTTPEEEKAIKKGFAVDYGTKYVCPLCDGKFIFKSVDERKAHTIECKENIKQELLEEVRQEVKKTLRKEKGKK